MFLDRVERMYENEKRTLDRKERNEWIGQRYKECPKCFHTVSKNKYVADEFCPICGTEIDWRRTDEK